MAASYTALYVHLVWGTAGREPWISEAIEAPLLAAIADKCRKLRCALLAIGAMPDHVHVLASLSPAVAVSRLVQEVKGASAHLVTHRLAPEISFRWQGGYGAFTLRDEDTPVVRRYLLEQKSHHAAAAVALEEPEACGNVKQRRLAYLFERPTDVPSAPTPENQP